MDYQCFGAVHISNVNQCIVFIRCAPISHERIQIGRVCVVVTPTGAVHLTQTGNREGLVLILGLGGVGTIVKVVVMIIGICICSVEP